MLDGWHDKTVNKLPNSCAIYGKSNQGFPYFFHVEIQLHRIVGTGFRIHFMYWIVGGRLFQCLLASRLTLLGGSKRWFYQHISSFFWIDGTTQKTPHLSKVIAPCIVFQLVFWHLEKNRTRSTGQRIHFMYWSLVGGRFYRWRNPPKKVSKKKVSRWHNSRI